MKKYRLKCYRCGNINEFILGDWYHCQKCNEQQAAGFKNDAVRILGEALEGESNE